MNTNNMKIGFIGAGYMGYGMANNLLKNNIPLSVIAHNNRKAYRQTNYYRGLKESKTLKNIAEFANVIIMCVTNTPIAIKIVNANFTLFKKKSTLCY